jgi:hypothetical protein
VARSTFSDANNGRPASFFAAVFAHMYQRCLAHAPRHKFKFKNKLYSLDATTVSLCLSLFPWASFRRTKAGVKLHTLLNHDGYLPAFVAITPAREHEIKKARALNLPKGSIVVEDLGYTDYAWYGQLTAQKIFFVTRQKSNPRYRVLGGVPSTPPWDWCPMRPSNLPARKPESAPSLCAASFTRTPKPARFMCSSPTTSGW